MCHLLYVGIKPLISWNDGEEMLYSHNLIISDNTEGKLPPRIYINLAFICTEVYAWTKCNGKCAKLVTLTTGCMKLIPMNQRCTVDGYKYTWHIVNQIFGAINALLVFIMVFIKRACVHAWGSYSHFLPWSFVLSIKGFIDRYLLCSYIYIYIYIFKSSHSPLMTESPF